MKSLIVAVSVPALLLVLGTACSKGSDEPGGPGNGGVKGTAVGTSDANPPVKEETQLGPFSHEEAQKLIDELIIEKGLEFVEGTNRLSDRSSPVLESLADIMRVTPDAIFRVAGHVETEETEEQNLQRSKNMAGNVVKALTEQGIREVFLRPRGYGVVWPASPAISRAVRKIEPPIFISVLPAE